MWYRVLLLLWLSGDFPGVCMGSMAYGIPFDTHCTERLLKWNWRFDTHTKGIADRFLDNGNNSDESKTQGSKLPGKIWMLITWLYDKFRRM